MVTADLRRRSLLGLSLVPGLGAVRVAALLRHFGSAEAAWTAPRDALVGVPGIGPVIAAAIVAGRSEDRIDRALRRARAAGAQIVTWLDADYPSRLRGIAASPPVLYVRGGWPAEVPVAAIVGTRRATPYGLAVAERLATALAQRAVTVVSGLARGIDAAAHWAVVRAGGSTVGVLGCGVDVVYPPEHRALMDAMTPHGALIAEAPMGASPERGAFPARNRLISGLADAVIVVEGDVHSGALITARQAAAQGRQVFAVPGSVYARGSRGPHHLLAAGARVLADPDDVLAALGRPPISLSHVDAPDARAATRTQAERALLAGLNAGDAKSIDSLASAAGMAIAEAAATLVALELRGLVRRLPGGVFAIEYTSETRRI